MSADLFVPLLSGAAANLAAAIVAKLKAARDANQKLAAADENRFHAALVSDSLKELGGYLDTTLGQFSVVEYAQNPEVRKRVNSFLARLEDFVGKDEEMAPSERAPQIRPDRVPALVRPKLELVQSRLERGYIWDALSSLRRLIEIELSQVAQVHGVVLPDRAGAGRKLQLLQQRELIAPDVAEELRYAIAVANRGVHGLDVGSDEAFEALRHAQNALGEIQALR